MIRLLAMDVGRNIAYGVSRRKAREAKKQLKRHKEIAERSAEFFECMQRPTSVDILKDELKRLDDIVGLLEFGKGIEKSKKHQ